MRSLCVPISVGNCKVLVTALSRIVFPRSASHDSSWDTCATTRPHRFSSTSTTVSREPYLRASEEAYDSASWERAEASRANRMFSGPNSCIRVRLAEGPTLRTGQETWSTTISATDPKTSCLQPVHQWVHTTITLNYRS